MAAVIGHILGRSRRSAPPCRRPNKRKRPISRFVPGMGHPIMGAGGVGAGRRSRKREVLPFLLFGGRRPEAGVEGTTPARPASQPLEALGRAGRSGAGPGSACPLYI